METIILWDVDLERIHTCETAIYQALKKLNISGTVFINSEAPLISRYQLWDRLPTLEIRGSFLSLHPGKPFTTQQLNRLFLKIFD